MQDKFKDPFANIGKPAPEKKPGPFKDPFQDKFGNDNSLRGEVKGHDRFHDRSEEQKKRDEEAEHDRLMQEFMEWETAQNRKDIDTLVDNNVPQVRLDEGNTGFVITGTDEAIKGPIAQELRNYIDTTFAYADLNNQFVQEFVDAVNKDIRQRVRAAVIEEATGANQADLSEYNYAVETMTGTNPMRSHNKIKGYDKDGKLVSKTPEEWVEYWQKHYSVEERARLFFESAHNPNLYKRIPYLIMSGGRGNAIAQYGFSMKDKGHAAFKQFWKDATAPIAGTAFGITRVDPVTLLTKGTSPAISGTGFAEGKRKLGIPENVTSKSIPWMSKDDYRSKVEEIQGKTVDDLTAEDKMFMLANDPSEVKKLSIGSFNPLDDNKTSQKDIDKLHRHFLEVVPNEISYKKYISARDSLQTDENLLKEYEKTNRIGTILLPSQEKLDLAQLYAKDQLVVSSYIGALSRSLAEQAFLHKLGIPDIGDVLATKTFSSAVEALEKASDVKRGIGAIEVSDKLLKAAKDLDNSFLARFVVGLGTEIPEDIIETSLDNVLTWHGDENADLFTLKSIGENTLQNLIVKTIWGAGAQASKSIKRLKVIRKAAREAGASTVDINEAIAAATDVVDALEHGRYEGLDDSGHVRYRDANGVVRTYSALTAPELSSSIHDSRLAHDVEVFLNKKVFSEYRKSPDAELKASDPFSRIYRGSPNKLVWDKDILSTPHPAQMNLPRREAYTKEGISKGALRFKDGIRIDLGGAYNSKGNSRPIVPTTTEIVRGLYVDPKDVVTLDMQKHISEHAAQALQDENITRHLTHDEERLLKKLAKGENPSAYGEAMSTPFVEVKTSDGTPKYRYIRGIDKEFDMNFATRRENYFFARKHPEAAELMGITGDIGYDTVAVNEAQAGDITQAPETGENFLEDQRYNNYTDVEYSSTTEALADMPSYSNLAAVQTWHQKAQKAAMADYDKNIMPKFQETYKTPEEQRAAVAKWDFMSYSLRKGRELSDLVHRKTPDKIKIREGLEGEVNLDVPLGMGALDGEEFAPVRKKLKPMTRPDQEFAEAVGAENMAQAFREGRIFYSVAETEWDRASFRKLKSQVTDFLRSKRRDNIRKKDLPKLNTDDYSELKKSRYAYRAAPAGLKSHLSKHGKSLYDKDWDKVFPVEPGEVLTPETILERYKAVADYVEPTVTDKACAEFFEAHPEQEEFFQQAEMRAWNKNQGEMVESTNISKKVLAKEIKALYDKGLKMGGEEGEKLIQSARTLINWADGLVDVVDGEYTGVKFEHADGTVYYLEKEDVRFYEEVIEPEMQVLRSASVKGLGRKNDHSIKGYLPQSDYNPTVETAEGVLDVQSGTLWRKNKGKMASDDDGNFSTDNLDLDLRNRLEIFANNMLWDSLGDRMRAAKLAEELSADGEKVSGEDLEKFFDANTKNAEAESVSEGAETYKKYIDEGPEAILSAKEGTTIDIDEDVDAVIKKKEKADKRAEERAKKKAAKKEVDTTAGWIAVHDKINKTASKLGAARAIKGAYSHIYHGNFDIAGQPLAPATIVESDWQREMTTKLGSLYDWGGHSVLMSTSEAGYLVDRLARLDPTKPGGMKEVFVDYLTQHGRRSRKGADYVATKWMQQLSRIPADADGKVDRRAILARLSIMVRQEGVSRMKKWATTANLDQLTEGNRKRLDSLLFRTNIVSNELSSGVLMKSVNKAVDIATNLRMKSLFYLNVRTGVLQLSETSRLFSEFGLGDASKTIKRLALDNDFKGEVDFWTDLLVPEGSTITNYEASTRAFNDLVEAQETRGGLKQIDDFMSAPVNMGENAKNRILIAGIYQEASNRGMTGQALYDYMNKKFERIGLAATRMGRLGYADNPFARLALNLKSFQVREASMVLHDILDNTKGVDGGVAKAVNYLTRVFGTKLAMSILFSKLGYEVSDILGLDPFGLGDKEYTGLNDETPMDEAMANIFNSGMTGFIADYYFAARRAYEQATPEEDRSDGFFGKVARPGEQESRRLADEFLLGLVPGATAAKRTAQMADLMTTGEAISSSGNRMYVAPTDDLDKLHGYLFGRNTTKAGRDYNQVADPLGGLAEGGYLGMKRELGRVFGDYRQFDPVDKENYSDWFTGETSDDAQWNSGYYYFRDKRDELIEEANAMANHKYSDEERGEISQRYNDELQELLDQVSKFAEAYVEKHGSIDAPKMRNLLNILNLEDYDVTRSDEENKEAGLESYNAALDRYTQMGLPQTIGYRGATTEQPTRSTMVQASPQLRAAVQGQYGLPDEAARVIDKLFHEKWRPLRKEYVDRSFDRSLTFDEREAIQREYLDKVEADLDGVVEAYGTDIFKNNKVDAIMKETLEFMIPYKEFMTNKKGRVNPSTPYAQPNYEKWLQAVYGDWNRSGSLDYREEASRTIADIRRLLDEGKIALAKARARIVLERVSNDRAYVSRDDLAFLNSVIRR